MRSLRTKNAFCPQRPDACRLFNATFEITDPLRRTTAFARYDQPSPHQVASLKFQVKPERRHEHRTAIAVVSRICYVLEARGNIDSAPDMGGVIGLHDRLAAIAQVAIPEQEAEPTKTQVFLMIFADPIRNNREARTILRSMPPCSTSPESRRESLID